MLYIDKPFEIGDYIEIGTDNGEIQHIGIRSTRLRTLTGNLLIISNRELISARINNYQRMQRRRSVIILGLHVDTNLEKIRELPTKINEVLSNIDNIQFDRAHLSNLGSFTLDFELVFFVTSRSYRTFLMSRENAYFAILDLLQSEGIELAYPTENHLIERGE